MSHADGMLLARIVHGRPRVEVHDRELDEVATSALLRLLAADLVTAEDLGHGYATYTATAHGRTLVEAPTVVLRRAPGLQGSRSSGDVALWAWLLLHGGVMASPYHDSPSLTPDLWHLLACGIDLAESSAVRDDTWTVWGGTFGDDGRETGVVGDAACRCGTVAELRVLATVDSVTDLLRQALTL